MCASGERGYELPPEGRTTNGSEISLLVLIRDVLARSNRQRHHRQRGVLAADRYKTRAVGYEQVLNIPALIESIQY